MLSSRRIRRAGTPRSNWWMSPASGARAGCSQTSMRWSDRASCCAFRAPTARARPVCCARCAACRDPIADEVLWCGRPSADDREAFHRELIYLGHAAALKDDLSARENLQSACLLGGVEPTDRDLMSALAAAGLRQREHLPARSLSQGQRRRVSLARLLLGADACCGCSTSRSTRSTAAANEWLIGVLTAQLRAGRHRGADQPPAGGDRPVVRPGGARAVNAPTPAAAPTTAERRSASTLGVMRRRVRARPAPGDAPPRRHGGCPVLLRDRREPVPARRRARSRRCCARWRPGVVWVAALLASMLSLGRLFADDHQDGTLEQLLLSVCPLPLIVLRKMAAHWLCSGLPLTLVAPLLALQFDLPAESIGVLVAVAADRHATAQPDRWHRRGADGGRARRRRAVVAAGAAVVCAGADLRRRRGRCGRGRLAGRCPLFAARGDAGAGAVRGTDRRRRSPADRLE